MSLGHGVWSNELMTNELMNQKTLIVAATYQELAPTFEHFGWTRANFIEHPRFDVLITGVGITPTAFAMGLHLNESYDLVLNVGIAGSFDSTLELGSLVNSIEDTFSELGAEDGDSFISIDELGFGKSVYTSNFPLDHPLLKNIPRVKSITVNTVHGQTKSIQGLLNRLDVKTESMEGAAIFYAAEQMNIPVLQIRSLSNYVAQRNKEHWKIGLAIKNLNLWLINYLNYV